MTCGNYVNSGNYLQVLSLVGGHVPTGTWEYFKKLKSRKFGKFYINKVTLWYKYQRIWKGVVRVQKLDFMMYPPLRSCQFIEMHFTFKSSSCNLMQLCLDLWLPDREQTQCMASSAYITLDCASLIRCPRNPLYLISFRRLSLLCYNSTLVLQYIGVTIHGMLTQTVCSGGVVWAKAQI